MNGGGQQQSFEETIHRVSILTYTSKKLQHKSKYLVAFVIPTTYYLTYIQHITPLGDLMNMKMCIGSGGNSGECRGKRIRKKSKEACLHLHIFLVQSAPGYELQRQWTFECLMHFSWGCHLALSSLEFFSSSGLLTEYYAEWIVFFEEEKLSSHGNKKLCEFKWRECD